MQREHKGGRASRYLTLKGLTHTVDDWVWIVGISKGTLVNRLKSGLSDEEALTRPIEIKFRNKN